MEFIFSNPDLKPEMVVADIGAGTGLLTKDLESRFDRVFAIEPNDDMRAALGKEALGGTAERTGLPDASVDVIFAAQAFHWFDIDEARREFRRILRSPKRVFLLWNSRVSEAGTGAAEIDALMNAMKPARDRTLEADPVAIAKFFETERVMCTEFENSTFLTKENLISMVLSRSYAPKSGEPGFDALVTRVGDIFDRHAMYGELEIPYRTQVYSGVL